MLKYNVPNETLGGEMISQEILNYITSDKILGAADVNNLQIAFDEESLSIKAFNNADIVYSPECSQKQVGIILDGTAIVEPLNSNKKVLLRTLSTSDMFGIANLYTHDQPFISLIIAKSPCRVLFLDADAFRTLLEKDSNAMRSYLEFMSRKIVFLNKKISTLTAGDTEKKLAFFLAENQYDGRFLQHTSMVAIAETLNVGRASLYRALDSLESRGLISRSGKEILIPDANALLNIE